MNVSHKFTGQEQDAETGLYNYVARQYDPVLGRFISADSIVPDISEPQSLNRYSYVMNNPLRYTDPTGHCGEFFGGCGFAGGEEPTPPNQFPLVAYPYPGGGASSGMSFSFSSSELYGSTTFYNIGYSHLQPGIDISISLEPATFGPAYDSYGTFSEPPFGANGRTTAPVKLGDGGTYAFSSPKLSGDFRISELGKKPDFVDVGISLAGSAASLVALATPAGRLAGYSITLYGMWRNVYKGFKGDLEWDVVYDRNVESAALAVGGEALRLWAPTIGVGYGVFKHQWGLYKGGKKLLYDPYQ